MRQFLSAVTSLAMLSAGVLGCSDTTGTSGDGITGTYVLRQIAGEPLPAVSLATEYATVTVVAETLYLSLDGRGRAGGTRVITPATAPAEQYRVDSPVRHAVRGRRFEGEYVCPPNALCAAPPHFTGTIIPNGLRLDFALGQRVPFLYERIRNAP